MKKSYHYVMSGLVFVSSSAAFASNAITPLDNEHKGFYVDFRLAASPHINLGGDLGYQFNRYFAAELGYLSNLAGTNLMAKVMLPIKPNFDFFGKLGYSFNTKGAIGELGAEYYITPKISVNAAVQHLFSQSTFNNYNQTSAVIGVGYHFSG